MRRVVSLITTALLASCYSASERGGDGSDAGPPPTNGGYLPVGGSGGQDVDAYYGQVLAAMCTGSAECLVAEPYSLDGKLLLEDPELCRQAFSRGISLDLEVKAMKKAIAERRVIWDADKAATCIHRISSGEMCFPGTGTPSETICQPFAIGTVEIGQPCKTDIDCRGDAYCEGWLESCGGICAARKPVGSSCILYTECSAGAATRGECEGLGGAGTCVEVTEVFGAAEGERCDSIETGEHTRTNVHCGEELYCSREDDTCRPWIAAGEPCDFYDVCIHGHICIQDGTSRCLPYRMAGEGERCTPEDTVPESELVVCEVLDNLRCHDDGVCRKRGDGNAGSACGDRYLEMLSCNPGLYCDEDAEQCAPLKSVGEACSWLDECESGYCDINTDTCAELCI